MDEHRHYIVVDMSDDDAEEKANKFPRCAICGIELCYARKERTTIRCVIEKGHPGHHRNPMRSGVVEWD